ncbi:MAG: OsmC family protein [Bdellovibrionales bacterium]|nr:OsmC family protein [Bdellovibrionales bacterium]
MVMMEIVYQGEKHCLLTHKPSSSTLETDAPKDNQGRGERFSPTDLMGAALGSCILTTMAIVSERERIQLVGPMNAQVEKIMANNPRRIETLKVHITLPASLSSEHRKRMEEIAGTCPVHRSLHPDIKLPMTFVYI